MPSSLPTLITNPIGTVFRRLAIRRRLVSTGLYETDWVDITRYVKNWGSTSSVIDDVQLNKFTNAGFSVSVRNDDGAFNPESNPKSLWFGYLTRYRTLVRVQSGYEDEAGNELPTDTTVGIFLLDGEIAISAVTNEAELSCKSLSSVFDEVRARDVPGLNATLTATEIVGKIRDHSDGAGLAIFKTFVTASSWIIQTTSTNYTLGTTTALEDLSCWDLMGKIAESESYILLINRLGGVEFRDREERTTTAAYTLYGQGFPRQNIISLTDYRESLDKYYTFFRFKWKEEDTATSYVTAGTSTAVSPANLSWKYGARVYEFENLFFATSTIAQTVVNRLYTEFSEIKEELTLKAKFIPDIEISDRVDLYYRSYDIAAVSVWDGFFWDEANWAEDVGENFEWAGVAFKVLSRRHDLNNFTTELRLRAI